MMQKHTAIEMLGGSVVEAAKRIGISYQAVYKWPDVLSPAVSDRVIAALSPKTKARVLKNSDLNQGFKAAISSSMDKPTASPFEWMGKSQAMAGTRAKSIKQIKTDSTRVNPESNLGYATSQTNSFKAPR